MAPHPHDADHQRPFDGVLTSTVLPVPDGEPIVSGSHGEMAYGYDADRIYPVTQPKPRTSRLLVCSADPGVSAGRSVTETVRSRFAASLAQVCAPASKIGLHIENTFQPDMAVPMRRPFQYETVLIVVAGHHRSPARQRVKRTAAVCTSIPIG